MPVRMRIRENYKISWAALWKNWNRSLLVLSGLLFLAMLFEGAVTAGTLVRMVPGDDLDAGIWAFGQGTTETLVSVYAMRMAAVFTLSVSTVALRTATVHRVVAFSGYAVALVLLLAAGTYKWTQLVFPLFVPQRHVEARSPQPSDHIGIDQAVRIGRPTVPAQMNAVGSAGARDVHQLFRRDHAAHHERRADARNDGLDRRKRGRVKAADGDTVAQGTLRDHRGGGHRGVRLLDLDQQIDRGTSRPRQQLREPNDTTIETLDFGGRELAHELPVDRQVVADHQDPVARCDDVAFDRICPLVHGCLERSPAVVRPGCAAAAVGNHA